MMISIVEFFDIERALQDKYKKWLILGSNHQSINEYYLIESDSNELDFGLGVAVAGTGIKPKVLFVESYQTVYVGFDSYIDLLPVISYIPE